MSLEFFSSHRELECRKKSHRGCRQGKCLNVLVGVRECRHKYKCILLPTHSNLNFYFLSPELQVN